MNIYTIGHLDGGRRQTHRVAEGASVGDILSKLGLDTANVSFNVDGKECQASEILYDGATVYYAMRNIKGA